MAKLTAKQQQIYDYIQMCIRDSVWTRLNRLMGWPEVMTISASFPGVREPTR